MGLYLTEVLACSPVMTSMLEHIFIWLFAICIYSFLNRNHPFFCWVAGFFFSNLYKNFLYSLDMIPLLAICVENMCFFLLFF